MLSAAANFKAINIAFIEDQSNMAKGDDVRA